ncbi:U32 family peptidase [Blastopirellula sp. JC732]|uniref:U32 family peptidase n=1 Tax=Blastopirellula sediminis TaxID=2894196 RepID=A0A9X1SFS9_9BACT|nr:U32 family peptidase [Blastopirellula sediminis]MCC9608545.1 U32 family peptidase [Blastopirellula sediminis]MCC9628678.1 U32 family peptidase [Blastopirellula sediminis]
MSEHRAAPELLAPAGNWDCAKAAVANGADAIYFGLTSGFNARARANNFEVEDLAPLMAFLHWHGVRGYVTLNTLAFSPELEAVELLVRQIAAAGVDALLVQDLGLVGMIRQIAPTLPIHASTQMTMTSAECIALATEMGVERVVLARELSIPEISAIHAETEMPLEAFVHGALCVAYSGQCLTSESLGGRSANRGQCAQACRLPYELICDGEDVDLGDQKYLLSPQDLAGFAVTPELIEAGVVSLKIEGRLKTPEYVANITRHYRTAIDAAVAGRPVEFTPRNVEEMELSFSRGFSVGWLHGCDHKMLVPAISSAKRGVLVGEVQKVQGQRVKIALRRALKAGDGIVFDGDRSAGEEQGGRVFALYRGQNRIEGEVSHGVVEMALMRDAIDLSQLYPGQKIWKSDDPELNRRLRKSFDGEIAPRDVDLHLHVTAAVDQPLQLIATVADLPQLQLQTEQPLEAARKHPLSAETLQEQFSRLGETGFRLTQLTADISGEPMAPLSVLGALRKQMVEQLTAARRAASIRAHAVDPQAVLPRLREAIPANVPTDDTPHLHLLCRTLDQLTWASEIGMKRLYADFADIREYRQAVAISHAAGAQIYLATPRIQKPGEMGIFKALEKQKADGILVRNLSGLRFYREREIASVADFSLNAANELTVDFLRRQGAERITASYDLNREQLFEMVRRSPTQLLEVVVHQHMPMFHMEHCVFCSVLSPGTNKTNCGRPCDTHVVRLRDRVGSEHLLTADVGCRNTLYNAAPQSGAEAVAALVDLGIRYFRVELLDEATKSQVYNTLDLYSSLLTGQITGKEVWTELKALNRVGVTRGTLEERRNPLAIL